MTKTKQAIVAILIVLAVLSLTVTSATASYVVSNNGGSVVFTSTDHVNGSPSHDSNPPGGYSSGTSNLSPGGYSTKY
jgi:hypothetical protein